jgi:nitroreductase
MTIRELVLKNRSFRRFDQNGVISEAQLRGWVELGRLTASGGNRQLLRYVLSVDAALNAKIFPCLAWAGYLTSWPGPAEGERPTAYVVIVAEKSMVKGCICDHGIAAQSILLGAAEAGMGGCMIASIKREELAAVLGLPGQYEILLVLALGKPAEKVVIDPVKDGNIKYWRDEQGVHHVPKYSLDEIVLGASGRD